MSAIFGSIIANLVPIVVTAIGSVIAWGVSKLTSAASSNNKAQAAAAKVGQIGLSIAGNIWGKLAPEIQARLADGDLSKADRAEILALVENEIKVIDVGGTVSNVASGLGLPLSGVIGTIAEWVINHFAKAHDASTPSVSALAYPVSPLPASASSAAPASARAG